MTHPVHANYQKVRNPSYWNSVYITLRLVVFFGPYTLMTSLTPVFKSMLALIGVFIAALARWTSVQLMYLFYGLCGYITIDEDHDSEET